MTKSKQCYVKSNTNNPFLSSSFIFRYNRAMKNKIRKYFLNKTVGIFVAAALVLSFFVGYGNSKSLLSFVNWITVIGFIYLSLGVLDWLWSEGEFAFFIWKPKQESYSSFKEKFAEKHQNSDYHLLCAGTIVTIIALICTILYTDLH